VKTEAARPTSVFTYGLPLAPMSWRILGDLHGWILLGAIPFMTGGFWLLWRFRATWWELLPATGGRMAAALGGGTAWLLCYVMTTNFPYRATLLVLLVPFWLRTREGCWLTGLLLAALWLHAPKYWLAPADVIAVPEYKRAMAVFTGIDQSVLLVVSTAVLVSLAGWAWRRIRTR
jgi:hypothetical protein